MADPRQRQVAEYAASALVEEIGTPSGGAITPLVTGILGQGDQDRERSLRTALMVTDSELRQAPPAGRGSVSQAAVRRWADLLSGLLDQGIVTVDQVAELGLQIVRASASASAPAPPGYAPAPPASAPAPPGFEDGPGAATRGGPPGTSFGDDED